MNTTSGAIQHCAGRQDSNLLCSRPAPQGSNKQSARTKEYSLSFSTTRIDRYRFHPLWAILDMLGLRLGEAFGLMWDDLDWSRGTVTVQRKLERDRFGAGLVLGERKTKGSRRTLTLTSRAWQALKAHEDRQKFGRDNTAGWQDMGLVFRTGIGTPLDQQRVHVHWTAATKKAGLSRYRIHDLRHTWASIQLMGGTPVECLAKMGGWSSVTMLFDVYGHIIPTDFQDGADVMDAALATAAHRT